MTLRSVGVACANRLDRLVVESPTRTNRPFQFRVVVGRTAAPVPDGWVIPFAIRLTRDSQDVVATLSKVDETTYLSSEIPALEGVWRASVTWADAGLSASSETVVDLAIPRFRVSVDPPPPRPNFDGGATYPEPALYRRDERAQVRLTWEDTDIDADTASIRVGDQVFRNCAPVDGGCVASVGLARLPANPVLNRLHDSYVVRAEVLDTTGNVAARFDEFEVTRLRWTFGPTAAWPLAMDEDGVVYATDATQSAILVLSRDGMLLKRIVPSGPVLNLSVGALERGERWVYVLERSLDGGVLGEAFEAHSLAARSWLHRTAGTAVAGPQLVPGVNETAVATFAGDGGVSIAWSVGDAGGTFFSRSAFAQRLTSMACDGVAVFATADSSIWEFSVAPASEKRVTTYPALQSAAVRAVASNGDLIVAGFDGGAYQLVRIAGSQVFPIGGASNAQNQWVLQKGATTWSIAWELGSSRLCEWGPTARCSSDDADEMILGEGGRLYTASSAGLVERDATTLEPRWVLPRAGFNLRLSCAPGGEAGHLVMTSRGGQFTLMSIVVDAKGIDATADWPMSHHDPRNTSNAKTPLSGFACP